MYTRVYVHTCIIVSWRTTSRPVSLYTSNMASIQAEGFPSDQSLFFSYTSCTTISPMVNRERDAWTMKREREKEREDAGPNKNHGGIIMVVGNAAREERGSGRVSSQLRSFLSLDSFPVGQFYEKLPSNYATGQLDRSCPGPVPLINS